MHGNINRDFHYNISATAVVSLSWWEVYKADVLLTRCLSSKCILANVFVMFTISVFTELCDCRGLWFYRGKWNMQWQTPIILKGNWVFIFILAWRALHQKVVVSAAFGEFPLEVCFLSFFLFYIFELTLIFAVLSRSHYTNHWSFNDQKLSFSF